MGLSNVEFRLGEIEHLPVAESSIDVILSNCVVNLSPDKAKVFREAFRVLKPRGRLAISDVVAIAAIPASLMAQAAALSGCVSGAAAVPALEALLADAGFTDIAVRVRPESREFIKDWLPGSGAEQCVASATITAVKPEVSCCAPGCCTS
jgi:SAM-dependent methyltransferase